MVFLLYVICNVLLLILYYPRLLLALGLGIKLFFIPTVFTNENLKEQAAYRKISYVIYRKLALIVFCEINNLVHL